MTSCGSHHWTPKSPTRYLRIPYSHRTITNTPSYLRLLDADADWREVTQIVLHIDPEREPLRAQQAYESHLLRARWMTKQGYQLLLRNGWPEVN